jgi:coproporphyrinogen dehydrogenase HemZ
VLKNHPVSRISVNPQTMNQKTLDIIGRKHTPEDTVRAFEAARQAGFDNINMDIIMGLPDEGIPEVTHTLGEIGKLRPDSLTVHSLAVKRASRLNVEKEEYADLTFRNSEEIMEMTRQSAVSMGLNPYYLYRQKNMKGNLENTGYASEGKEGLYNMLIMEETESILAAGAGASTKFVQADGRISRVVNPKDVRTYISRIDELIGKKRTGA